MLEFDYIFVPVAGFLVQPTVQYIASSGASSATKDIWVFGLKTFVRF